ncbi:MAG TPA: carboxypeptidase-like regulatory domain-containing protein, partial [Acidobacteriaceae bacterium]
MEQQKKQRMRGWNVLLTLLALFAWLGVLPRHASAQDYRAKITVEVKDASDAMVPGAELTLTRLSTKQTVPAKTDSQGVFI